MGPFVRPSVAHPRHRAAYCGIGRHSSALPTRGAIIPLTRVNPGGQNTRRGDRIRRKTEGVRCERADGRCTHRVLT